jgi:hypothetical protein
MIHSTYLNLKEPTPKYKTLKGEVMEAWISEILPEWIVNPF